MNFNALVQKYEWKQYDTTVGTAEAIPAAIAGITSADPTIRNHNYWRIENYVVRQSDLYSSALPTTEVLCSLLSSKIEHGRVEMYDILYEIVNGCSFEDTVIIGNTEMRIDHACIAIASKYNHVFQDDSQHSESNDVRERAYDLLELIESKTPTCESPC